MKLAIKNLIPLFLNGKATRAGQVSGPKPFAKDFLQLLTKGLKGDGTSSVRSQTESGAGGKLESCIEKLRRTLLAHGKSLSRSSLKGEDVLLLRDLLCECGLAPAEVHAVMNQLLQQSENGEIKLSRFLEETRKVASQEQETSKTRLEPSAIPLVESLLRERGLEPRAVDRLIETSRTTGGALDLERLNRGVEKVDTLKGESSRQAKLRSDKPAGQPTESLTNGRQGDTASTKDLIKQRLDTGEAIPKKVENVINQILEKAVVPEEKQAAPLSFSPPVLDRANLIKALEPKLQESRVSPKKGVARVDSLNLESPRRFNRSQEPSSSKSRSVTPNHPLEKEDQEPISESLSRSRKERGSGVQAESKVFSFQHPRLGTEAPEPSMNPIQKAQTQPIPPYLLEQVTRQISRSVSEGDKVVKLLLKPPELGYLILHVDMKDHTLKLGMRTETSSAQKLLISGASELKETLMAHGIKIERMDIQIDDQLRQSFSFSQGGQGEAFMERSDQTPIVPEIASLGEGRDDPPSVDPISARDDHLIDVKI